MAVPHLRLCPALFEGFLTVKMVGKEYVLLRLGRNVDDVFFGLEGFHRDRGLLIAGIVSH